MTYAYGMKNAPEVGKGLGGLPRREVGGVSIKPIQIGATATAYCTFERNKSVGTGGLVEILYAGAATSPMRVRLWDDNNDYGFCSESSTPFLYFPTRVSGFGLQAPIIKVVTMPGAMQLWPARCQLDSSTISCRDAADGMPTGTQGVVGVEYQELVNCAVSVENIAANIGNPNKIDFSGSPIVYLQAFASISSNSGFFEPFSMQMSKGVPNEIVALTNDTRNSVEIAFDGDAVQLVSGAFPAGPIENLVQVVKIFTR